MKLYKCFLLCSYLLGMPAALKSIYNDVWSVLYAVISINKPLSMYWFNYTKTGIYRSKTRIWSLNNLFLNLRSIPFLKLALKVRLDRLVDRQVHRLQSISACFRNKYIKQLVFSQCIENSLRSLSTEVVK